MTIFGVGIPFWQGAGDGVGGAGQPRVISLSRHLYCIFFPFYLAIVASWSRLVLLSLVIHDTPVGVNGRTNSLNGLSYN